MQLCKLGRRNPSKSHRDHSRKKSPEWSSVEHRPPRFLPTACEFLRKVHIPQSDVSAVTWEICVFKIIHTVCLIQGMCLAAPKQPAVWFYPWLCGIQLFLLCCVEPEEWLGTWGGWCLPCSWQLRKNDTWKSGWHMWKDAPWSHPRAFLLFAWHLAAPRPWRWRGQRPLHNRPCKRMRMWSH